jgi:hypothetical protein
MLTSSRVTKLPDLGSSCIYSRECAQPMTEEMQASPRANG